MAKRKKRATKKKVAKKVPRKATKKKPRNRSKAGGRAATQFRAGQSGNPAGRPKADMDVRAAAREQTQAAIDTLVKAMRCRSQAVRVKAAVALLDRGWGRPAQDLNVDVVTHEETLTMLAERLKSKK